MRSLTKQKRKKFPKGALLLFMIFIIILQIIDINTINVHAASGVSADGINMNVSAIAIGNPLMLSPDFPPL